jgi:hypothetical protein
MPSPLEKYNKTHSNRWDVLVDIPDWERQPLINWVSNALRKKMPSFSKSDSEYNQQVLIDIQRKERIMFTELGINDISSWYDIKKWLSAYSQLNDPGIFLLLLELIVKHIRDSYQDHEYINFGYVATVTPSMALSVLDRVLENGSKWKVVTERDSPAGLVERVNPHIQTIAENAKNNLLDNAWAHAYGLHPDPEKAIHDAQAAIEQIASETGLTNATTGVYGAIIGDVRSNLGKLYFSVAKPEFDKGLDLSKASDKQVVDDQFATWFWNGMDLIQKTHPTRHKSKETNGFKISVDAARQAVLTATLLHEMIARGYITKKSKIK